MLEFEDVFRITDLTFKTVGLHDIYRKPTSLINSSRFLYLIGMFNLVPTVMGEFYYNVVVLQTESDLKEIILTIANALPCVIESTYTFTKTASVLWYKQMVFELFRDLKEMWPAKHEDIVEESMLPTKHVCTIYTVVTNVLAIVCSCLPILSMVNNPGHGWLTLFYIWYPYDCTATWGMYVFHYISQTYAGLFTTLSVSALDCLYCIFIAQLCMHLKVLRENVLNLGNGDHECQMKTVVDYHNKIITFAQKVEEIFGFSIVVNLGACSVIICLSTFAVTISPLSKLFTYVLFLSSALLQTMMMCTYGQQLMDDSTNIALAAYESDWIGKDQDHLKGLMMIQIRASKPVAISAMGFFEMSLGTFAKILKASYSYFALLNTIYKEP